MFQRFCMRMTCHLLAALSVLAAAGLPGRCAVRERHAVAPELKLEGVRFRVYRGDALRAVGEADGHSLRRDSSELRAAEPSTRRCRATAPRSGSPPRAGEGSLLSRVFEASGRRGRSRRGDDVARTERARYEPARRRRWSAATSRSSCRAGDTGSTARASPSTPPTGTIVVRGGARLVAGLPEAR